MESSRAPDRVTLMGRRIGIAFAALGFGVLSTSGAMPTPLKGPVAVLRSVGAEGRGNDAAAAAWRRVADAPGSAVPALLESMDGANDYALNWLRSAIESIEQRERTARPTSPPLPAGAIEAFLKDTRHHPKARRLAYEILTRMDKTAPARLLPGFVSDPANDLRRDAVDLLAKGAAQKVATDKAGAIAAYRQALGHAREADQLDLLAKKLTDLGEKVDLQKTFGWITRWRLIGPFDNTTGAGFNTPFPPESGVNQATEYDGKKGRVRWVDFASKSDYGLIDFNVPFGSLKEVTGYAQTKFWSDKPRTVQLRLGCKNGWKIWVNGKFVFGRDEYHRSMEIDQYRLPIQLKAGRNEILVKCCQNEQTEDWTKEWEFQLRITDDQGTPIPSSR